MEVRTEVKTFIVKLHCNFCKAEMKFKPEHTMLYTGSHTYECSNCSTAVNSTTLYPKMDYEVVKPVIMDTGPR